MVIGALIVVVLAVAAAALLLPRLLRGELGALREQAASELTSRNADVDRRLQAVVETMASKASDEKLKGLLRRSVGAIATHTSAVRAMLPSHVELQCRGMQGLVEEASRHAIEADLPAGLRFVI